MHPFTPRLPRRSPEHITDTMAARELFRHLPAECLVRSMEERDYGIDLQLELFDCETPLGQFALAQLKGTRASFKSGDVTLTKFPVKTIEYAMLFDVPFFAFYTSVTDKVTRFVWLQRYASIVLPTVRPKWREQDEVPIKFPASNQFAPRAEIRGNSAASPPEDDGWEKLKKFMAWPVRRREALEVLRIAGELQVFGDLALGKDPYQREPFIEGVKRLPQLTAFFGEEHTELRGERLRMLTDNLAKDFAEASGLNDTARKQAKRRLRDLLESLRQPLDGFLGEERAAQAGYGVDRMHAGTY